MTTATRTRLRNIAEIRSFFRTNDQPIYFVGPTGFNLLGLDRWVRNFNYVTYYDAWDGAHPRVFIPPRPYEQFESAEEINNYLLVTRGAAAAGRARRAPQDRHGLLRRRDRGDLRRARLRPDPPVARAAVHLDSKIVTTRLGDEVGAPSVPNVIATVTTYDELLSIAHSAGLGADLVVQTPYGDSGKTTFFIASEEDWRASAEQLEGNEVKVMKRINHTAVAVEAVITRHGTVVGPFMTDLTGYPELTPYQGGWCGNDLFPEALSDVHRAKATRLVSRLGDRLAQEGYKGFFEVDVLVDLDTDEVYLGELNPRISGASSMTNVTAGAYADIPLFLFHLLEYLDVDYDLDVDEINERWRELAAVDVWSQLIMKEPKGPVEQILTAPRTGQWSLAEDGSISFRRPALDWHGLQDDTECFFLRVYGPGDYRFKGADLGVVVTKGRLQTDEPKELTARCRRFIEGIRGHYASAQPLSVTLPTLPFSAPGSSAL